MLVTPLTGFLSRFPRIPRQGPKQIDNEPDRVFAKEAAVKTDDPYTSAHLVVSAIRILEHRHNAPPSVEEVCKALSASPEKGNLLCRKLHEGGIIEIVEGAFGTRLFVKDHLKIEDLPRREKTSGMSEEIRKFKDDRANINKKIESFQAKQAERQKNLFAEIENKLKKGTDK